MSPGEERSYMTVDNIRSRNIIIKYQVEILNRLEPTGTVPHYLLLNIWGGGLIMLIRRLDSPKLCNVTILTIKYMMPYIPEATIMSRKYAGVKCFIFRIPMKLNDLVFEFEMPKFAVRLSFAMTINISQDQSVKVS